MATQPLRARRRHSAGVKVFSKRTLPHQVTVTCRAEQALGQRLSAAGGAASSTKWNPVCAGLGDQRLDAVDQQVGRPVVAPM
jgi:hypothetical protein